MPEVKKNTEGEELQLSGKPNAFSLTSKCLTGRKVIYTDEDIITAENVVRILNQCLPKQISNCSDIKYLHDYLSGKQPILDRIKQVRNEICNKIVVNRANQIVTFKTANFIGEPLQYVSRGTKKSVPKQIEKLNSLMLSENKHSKDMRLAYWMFTCGLGYRLVLNDKAIPYANRELFDEAPFEVYTLDSRNSFVVRLNDVTKRVVFGCNYVFLDENSGKVEYTVYTDNQVFVIEGSTLTANKVKAVYTHNFGMVPIVEYACNPLRMGAFEPVIGMLDAINTTESNRLDGIEQFIQALMVFENADITREQFLELKDLGAIKLPSVDGRPSKVYYLNEQLDQSQTQTLIDDMWQTVLQIVGMPSQGNANTSDSSNNGAIMMKNGWWDAEARAKETEGMWKEAETDFLKIILKICNDAGAVNLHISDISMKFFRRSYEDKLTKVQSFTTLIGAGCPPIQAFTISEMVIDPESAAIAYEDYQKQKEADLEAQLEREKPTETIVTEKSDGGEVTEEE